MSVEDSNPSVGSTLFAPWDNKGYDSDDPDDEEEPDQLLPDETKIWAPGTEVAQLTGQFEDFTRFGDIPRAAPDAKTWAGVQLWLWWPPPTSFPKCWCRGTVHVTYTIYYFYLRFLRSNFAGAGNEVVVQFMLHHVAALVFYFASAGVCPRASVAVRGALFSTNVKQIVFVFLQSAPLRHFAVASVCRTVSRRRLWVVS